MIIPFIVFALVGIVVVIPLMVICFVVSVAVYRHLFRVEDEYTGSAFPVLPPKNKR